MNGNRALAVWVSMGGIASAAVWGGVGRGGDGFPAHGEWLRWFVLEGPIDIALWGLCIISLILAFINYRWFLSYQDTDYLRNFHGDLNAALTAAVTVLVVYLIREGVIHV